MWRSGAVSAKSKDWPKTETAVDRGNVAGLICGKTAENATAFQRSFSGRSELAFDHKNPVASAGSFRRCSGKFSETPRTGGSMRFLCRSVAVCVALVAFSVSAETSLPVEILTVKGEPQVNQYSLTGTIEAKESFPAAFRDGGRLLSVSAHTGDNVSAGQELARVDPTQALAAQAAARASLQGAEAALTQATQAHDRAAGLLARGSATQSDVDSATEALISARAARDQAAAQLSKAETAVNDTVLRATAPSIVTERLAEPGQVVGPGQTVVWLAGQEGREAVFYVPDGADLDGLVGMPVDLSLLDAPDVPLQAELTEISPLVDSATSTTKVKATVTSSAGAPLIGAPVVAHVSFAGPPAIRVPWTSLTSTSEGAAVWTVDSATMTVQLAPVVVRDYKVDGVVIDQGLSDGQMVVGAGSQMLYPGRPVIAAEVQP